MTGANAGLGYATASALASRKAEVHLLCRSKERGEEARQRIVAETGNAAVHAHVVDVSNPASVRSFASGWGSKKIDVLVNNAGVLPQRYEAGADGKESSMGTALGQTYLLTGLLLPALCAAGRTSPSRVINVSSGGGLTVRLNPSYLFWTSRRKEDYNGTLQYAYAKRAQMMLTELWARKLASARMPVVVHAMHPGWAETPGVTTSLADFAKKQEGKLRTPEQGADTIVWLAASKDSRIVSSPGTFWFDREPASLHFPLDGTRSSEAEYDSLWATCAKEYGWQLEG